MRLRFIVLLVMRSTIVAGPGPGLSHHQELRKICGRADRATGGIQSEA
jgi:hypothetical protein